jgi:hypothetical protein
MKPTTKRKRVYPRRERRLTETTAAAIIRQRYQFTAAHLELCQTLIEIQALRERLGALETFELEEPHRELTSHDAAAIASDFLTNCKLELDPRTHRLRPRRPQPHRPTETRLHDYIRHYRRDLERRTTDTTPIRLTTHQP